MNCRQDGLTYIPKGMKMLWLIAYRNSPGERKTYYQAALSPVVQWRKGRIEGYWRDVVFGDLAIELQKSGRSEFLGRPADATYSAASEMWVKCS